ncbi:hypothetical protein KAR26_01065 [Candidatus Parcubacteria bacterium]|nr:hypothetical protein [Candidatus Parcubacteria bacterium]
MIKNILESKKSLIIGGTILILIIAVGVWFSGTKEELAPEAVCEPLTPLTLQEFEAVSGARPIKGEKCTILSLPDSFLIKLAYDSAEAVAGAKLSLVAGTEGEKKIINEISDWVVLENDSSVFMTFPESNPNELGILVLLGIESEPEVKSAIQKIIDTGVMSATLSTEPETMSTPAPFVSGECKSINLSSNYQTYWLYDSNFPCNSYSRVAADDKFSIRCLDSISRWREHYVKEISTNGASKLRIKADLGLYVHDKFFVESGGVGVKYDDYVSLWAVSENPNPALSSECNKGYTQDTVAKCSVSNTHPGLLDKCGVAKYTASKNCDFEINVSGLDKVYLVFYTSDAWPADPEGSFSNLEICYQ